MTNRQMLKHDFSSIQMGIVNACAIECERQQSGERSVARLLRAYNYAMQVVEPVYLRNGRIRQSDIVVMATYIHPENHNQYRLVPVQVGGEIISWENIQHQMQQLEDLQENMTSGELVKRFLDIHPFVDGNGRTAFVLYNLLNHTLEAPDQLPNFYNSVV
jgi:hypothetical protein